MRTRHSHAWLTAAALAVGLVLAAPATLRAGFEEGSAAYQQGDYAKALEEWTPLAEHGNQQAQYNIGYMHFNGIGVPKEPAKAAKWFAMAAEQGDAAAQMSLGVMYGTGQGVQQDYSQAYIWLTLAAARLPYGDDRDQAVKNRDIVSAKMSRAQITEALGQALNWTPKAGNGGSAQPVSASVPPVAPAAGSVGANPGAQIAAAESTPAAAPPAPVATLSDAQTAAAKAAEAKAKAAAEAKAMEEAKAAAEAKAMEEAKAAAEAKAMEEAKAAAEAKAMEEAKAAAEAKAMEEAKAAAEAKAMEEAKAAAEAKAMEEAKAEAEAKAMEEAKAAAEAKAMEEAKAVVEAKAMEEAKAAAEAKAIEEAKAAAEAKAMEEAKAAASRTQTAALTAGTGFLVQLAALRTMSAAESEWSRLKRLHADVLGQFEPVLQAVDLGSKGNFVRVQVGPFANANEAGTICQALRARKQDCVVVSAAGRV
jgi:chemotaxis protein histidine kinase CheA